MSFRCNQLSRRQTLVAGAVIASLAGPTLAQHQVWLRQFGSGGSDFGRALAPDGAGGVIGVGWTDGSLGGPNAGLDDAIIVRYDSAGNQLWILQFGTTGADALTAVTPDGVGGTYVVGYTDGVLGNGSQGGRDAFVARYDGAGNQLWLTQGASSLDDEGTAVAPDGAGGVFVVGNVLGGVGGSDVFLVRFDSSGTHIWGRQIGSSADDFADALAPDGSGGVFVAGKTEGDLGRPNSGGEDAFLARYDANGNQLWLVQFGTSNSEHAHALAPDGTGGVYVVGDTEGSLGGPLQGEDDAYIARYDGTGSQLWITQFGTPGADVCITAAPDGTGGLIVAGETTGSLGGPNAGGVDAFVAHFDGTGAVFWIHQFGTAAEDVAAGVTADGTGVMMVSGITAGELGAPNAGLFDVFVARFTDAACYADCDQSGVLDIFDFLCFQNSFVSGEPYACECDPDPVCDIFDFLCFQNAFVAGCP